ncbi:MAG: LacI family DNA-binding transcriptional regulator [Victivallales bacterium]|nr:LacI family DNA-binding transcriptional regulator [Victivallales bacterium]
MVKLKDIAERAGVSVSVVSRTLNPKPDKNAYVSDEIRSLVMRTARDLGYRPNRMAEFLKRGRNAAIGAFLPEIPNRLVADLMFGISMRAAEFGFPLEFHYGMDYDGYVRFIDTVSASNSGIITYPYMFDLESGIDRVIDDYKGNGGHIVVLNCFERLDVPVLSIDDVHGGRLAAEHLLGRACHKFIAFSSFPARAESFADTLAARNIPCSVVSGDDFESELDGIIVGCDKPLGVFATSDALAVKIINFLRRQGMAVGDDVLVVGYDDLYISEFIDPALTTVHQPFKELGGRAVEKVVGLIYGNEEKSEYVKPYMVVRESA